jgi:hypothetical protein
LITLVLAVGVVITKVELMAVAVAKVVMVVILRVAAVIMVEVARLVLLLWSGKNESTNY